MFFWRTRVKLGGGGSTDLDTTKQRSLSGKTPVVNNNHRLIPVPIGRKTNEPLSYGFPVLFVSDNRIQQHRGRVVH